MAKDFNGSLPTRRFMVLSWNTGSTEICVHNYEVRTSLGSVKTCAGQLFDGQKNIIERRVVIDLIRIAWGQIEVIQLLFCNPTCYWAVIDMNASKYWTRFVGMSTVRKGHDSAPTRGQNWREFDAVTKWEQSYRSFSGETILDVVLLVQQCIDPIFSIKLFFNVFVILFFLMQERHW